MKMSNMIVYLHRRSTK